MKPNQAINLSPDFQKILNTTVSGVGLFKSITTNSGNSIIDFEFVFLNYEALKYFKNTEDNLLGKNLSQEYPAFVLNGFFERMKTTILTGEETHKEEYSNHEGYANWFKYTATKFDNDHIVVTILDVELYNANQELNKLSQILIKCNEELEEKIQDKTRELELSNERFRLLSLATNDISWDWDLTKNQLLFNESFESGFGYKLQDIPNHYEFWKSRLHVEDAENVINSLQYAIESNDINSWRTEYRFLNVYGSFEPILDRGYIIRDKSGNPIRVVGAMLKISNIQELKDRLNTSEQIHRILAESMPQLVFSINEKGEGDYFNKRWYEYTGKDPYYIFPHTYWDEIIHPDDNIKAYILWQESIVNNTNYSAEIRLKDKYGNYRWFLSIAVQIKNEQGQITRWIGTSTDIHDQKTRVQNLENIEKQLNHDLSNLNVENQKLELQNKDLDSFIHVASHDLRSPIKNMDYLLNELKKEINPYQDNQNLQEIFNLVQKTMTVLNTLVLDLTEVPMVNQNIEAKPTLELDTIYQEIITSIGDLILKNKPVFHTDFQINSINISSKDLRSIFYNLISNAIKYRSEDKSPEIFISCKLSEDKQQIQLQFKDNGMGIKKSDLPYVFVPFKRLHKIGHGMGLGLSNIKEKIEKNGGTISVKSEENQGTTFLITFPLILINC